MELLLALVALIGHGYLWVAWFNYTHGTAMHRRIGNPLTAVAFLVAAATPVALGMWFYRMRLAIAAGRPWSVADWPAGLYVGLCCLAGVLAVARWVWRRALRRPPAVLRHHRSRIVDLAPRALSSFGNHDHHFLVHLPFNQALKLDVAERALEVPHLAPALDGLAVAHLSDFHFTGRLGKRYFEEAVRAANELEPDLFAVTGDLVDHPDYVDWIPDTLGKLSARYGVYFILGNHDLWTDPAGLRGTLRDLGWVDVGGRWIEADFRGEPVVLAGNELPWIRPAADLRDAPPPAAQGGPLRIALAHTPDQLRWARTHHVDLLLAGHTHGGQIRFPLIGPILSANRLGAAYSSGVFHLRPTSMHVTRGVSGELPLRINCPPELGKLVLRAAL
ncbi:MAG: metallophosphoesterase [Planctomycetota bacterium]|jgi:predicted MPP superfamily phosphohydrolase